MSRLPSLPPRFQRPRLPLRPPPSQLRQCPAPPPPPLRPPLLAHRRPLIPSTSSNPTPTSRIWADSPQDEHLAAYERCPGDVVWFNTGPTLYCEAYNRWPGQRLGTASPLRMTANRRRGEESERQTGRTKEDDDTRPSGHEGAGTEDHDAEHPGLPNGPARRPRRSRHDSSRRFAGHDCPGLRDNRFRDLARDAPPHEGRDAGNEV